MIKHLSYSSVALWNACPTLWHKRYILGVKPPISVHLPFGTAVHRTIQESLVNGGLDNAKAQKFGKIFSIACAESQFFLSQDDKQNMVNLGIAMLSDPSTQYIINSIPVQSTEQIERKILFDVPGVDIPVLGYIDIIDDDGQLYDIKTSRWDWTDSQAQNELQPDFYLTAMDFANDSRHGGEFNHLILRKQENAPAAYIITSKRDLGYQDRVYESVQIVWQGIQLQAWELHSAIGGCANCAR